MQAVGVVDVVAGELFVQVLVSTRAAGGGGRDGWSGMGMGMGGLGCKGGGGLTVSLSQLIQRGTMMLVRVMAQAALIVMRGLVLGGAVVLEVASTRTGRGVGDTDRRGSR